MVQPVVESHGNRFANIEATDQDKEGEEVTGVTEEQDTRSSMRSIFLLQLPWVENMVNSTVQEAADNMADNLD